MELQTGVCGICSSRDLILNSKDSGKYVDSILGHFQEELNVSKELGSNCDLCPVCVYQITQIISKNGLFSNQEVNENVEDSDMCKMCKGSNDILTIKDESFLNKCKPWMADRDAISLCTSCFYLVDVRHVLRDRLRHKLSVNDETKCTPIRRSLTARRKSTCEDKESIQKENTSRVLNNSSESDAISDGAVNSTPVQKKGRRRSKNLGELLDAETTENCDHKEEDSELSKVYKKNKLAGFNFSNISNFSPLCSSGIKTADEVQQDKKLFNYVPFVKMKNFKETELKKNAGSYVCTLMSQRAVIKVRRTPPIKIKSIKNLNLTKEKKKSNDKQVNNAAVLEAKSSPPVEEDSKKLVVVLERIKLPPTEPENESFEKTNTPKKKKRVHFDDTPTIIITEDDYSDDVEQKNKNDENRKNIQTKSIMVSEQSKEKEEKSNSESENEEEIKKESKNGSFKTATIQNEEQVNGQENEENNEKQIEETRKTEEIQDVEMEENREDTGSSKKEEKLDSPLRIEDFEDEDSFEGFELIDHDDEDLKGFPSEPSKNNSSQDVIDEEKVEEIEENANKEKDNVEENGETEGKILSDNMEEIELLLEKYTVVDSEKDVATTEEVDKQIKDVEDKENTETNKVNETEEDFGSLIDEVQKCLLSPKEILDKSDQIGAPQEQLGILEASSSGMLEVFDASFNENGAINEEKEKDNNVLKRKHEDEETEESNSKRGKTEIF